MDEEKEEARLTPLTQSWKAAMYLSGKTCLSPWEDFNISFFVNQMPKPVVTKYSRLDPTYLCIIYSKSNSALHVQSGLCRVLHHCNLSQYLKAHCLISPNTIAMIIIWPYLVGVTNVGAWSRLS